MTGPGIGQPGGGQRIGQRQRRRARGGRRRPAAPTPTSTGHTALLRTGGDVVARSCVQRMARPAGLSRLARTRDGSARAHRTARATTRAPVSMSARIAAQLVQERSAPVAEVGRRLEQLLVGGHLPRGGEQQRRHRLVAAHQCPAPRTGHRPPAPIRSVPSRRCRQARRTARRRRSRRPRRTGAASRLPSAAAWPAATRRRRRRRRRRGPPNRRCHSSLLGDVRPEGRRVGEVEVELQQVAQPHRLGPERLHPLTVRSAAGVQAAPVRRSRSPGRRG